MKSTLLLPLVCLLFIVTSCETASLPEPETPTQKSSANDQSILHNSGESQNNQDYQTSTATTTKLENFELMDESFCQGALSYSYNESLTLMKCECYNSQSLNLDVFIYDFNKAEVIFEYHHNNAKASWYSDSKLLIHEYSGIIRDGQTADDYSFIYDLFRGSVITNSVGNFE